MSINIQYVDETSGNEVSAHVTLNDVVVAKQDGFELSMILREGDTENSIVAINDFLTKSGTGLKLSEKDGFYYLVASHYSQRVSLNSSYVVSLNLLDLYTSNAQNSRKSASRVIHKI